MRLLESLAGREFVLALIDEGLEQGITFEDYPRSAEYLLGLRERVNREIAQATAQPPRARQLRA